MDKTDIGPAYYRLIVPTTVIEIGTVKQLQVHPDRILPFWVFAVVTGGKMPIVIGSDQTIVEVGQYFLLPPGVRHRGPEQMPFDTIWVHFSVNGEKIGAVSSGEASAGSGLVLPVFGSTPPEFSYGSWAMLIKRYLSVGAMKIADVGPQLDALLGLVAAEYKNNRVANSPAELLARRTLDLLVRNFREPITSECLSRELGYSYAHIERVFRRQYGSTIRQKLNQARIAEASAMLVMGKSLNEAANETGFDDYYYFIRVFTKLKGKSPGKLIAEIRGSP